MPCADSVVPVTYETVLRIARAALGRPVRLWIEDGQWWADLCAMPWLLGA